MNTAENFDLFDISRGTSNKPRSSGFQSSGDRLQKVALIRQLIESGGYKVDSGKLALCLTQSLDYIEEAFQDSCI